MERFTHTSFRLYCPVFSPLRGQSSHYGVLGSAYASFGSSGSPIVQQHVHWALEKDLNRLKKVKPQQGLEQAFKMWLNEGCAS